MQILTIDFETFYSQKFSLSKMTTEEYVRDSEFEVIGVSVKVDAGETKFFSGPKAATKMFLERFDWDNAIAVAHNAVFDMAILNWHFDIRPKRIVDTLSMLSQFSGSAVAHFGRIRIHASTNCRACTAFSVGAITPIASWTVITTR